MRIHLPEGVYLIGYADDVALTITSRDMQVTQERLNLVMRRINLWMGEHGLQLAIPKTDPHTIRTKTAVKYLGVLLVNNC